MSVMENFDIVILSAVVTIAFALFIILTIVEFNKMNKK